MRPNESIKSASVAEGVVDMSTGELVDLSTGKVVATSTGERAECGTQEIGVFQNCTKLNTVMLPESLRKIGGFAFYECRALVHVDIPSGVNEIGVGAFCLSALETATIPEGVVNLPERILYKCHSLKSVKLPSSLKTIGKYAFAQCASLPTINFDGLEGVTEIGEYAFGECLELSTIKLPPLLKTIEESTFAMCYSLSKVELPPSLETIKKFAFGMCYHPDLCITVPETMKSIEVSKIGMYMAAQCGANTMGGYQALAGLGAGSNLGGGRVCLPTSLQFLRNGWDLEGLLHKIQEVVISCKVDVQLLVNFVDLFEDKDVCGRPFLKRNLTFRVLHCETSDDDDGVELPPIDSHVPLSTFSYDMTLRELKRFAEEGNDLSAVVRKEYLKRKEQCAFPGCAALAPLRCARCVKARYCSREHQKAHWKAHKKHCVPAGKS